MGSTINFREDQKTSKQFQLVKVNCRNFQEVFRRHLVLNTHVFGCVSSSHFPEGTHNKSGCCLCGPEFAKWPPMAWKTLQYTELFVGTDFFIRLFLQDLFARFLEITWFSNLATWSGAYRTFGEVPRTSKEMSGNSGKVPNTSGEVSRTSKKVSSISGEVNWTSGRSSLIFQISFCTVFRKKKHGVRPRTASVLPNTDIKS